MNKIQYILMILPIIIISSCNKSVVDTEPEDYKMIFGKAEIPKPEFDYDLMPTFPCNPLLEEKTYSYSGKEIEKKKKYTVTLKFWFVEKEQHVGLPNAIRAKSDISFKYVDENKKLKVLKTRYSNFLVTPDLENDVVFEREFEAESGFPIFLGISGTGFDYYEVKASIRAVSKDRLIETPVIEYQTKEYVEGGGDSKVPITFCETIILP